MQQEIDFEVVSLSEVPVEAADCLADKVPLVLVVDDEPLICETVAAVLATSGLAVIKAHCGTRALELALRQTPDLLLSDVMMGGMNGIELAITIATELPACKVLLFSGHASLKDLAPAQACGFDFPLMTKPIHPVELLKRVFDCLDWQPRPTYAERISAERLPLPASMEAQFVA